MGDGRKKLLIIGYLPHRFNWNCFFRTFNWVNTPKSSLSKVLISLKVFKTLYYQSLLMDLVYDLPIVICSFITLNTDSTAHAPWQC